MTKHIAKEQASALIFDAYVDNIGTALTDQQLRSITGLTVGQFARGKVHLRETVAADEHYMYVSQSGRGGGSYLTRRPEDAREYTRGRTKVFTKQLRRIQSGTLRELDLRDPSAVLITRQIDRLIEDLHFVGEHA